MGVRNLLNLRAEQKRARRRGQSLATGFRAPLAEYGRMLDYFQPGAWGARTTRQRADHARATRAPRRPGARVLPEKHGLGLDPGMGTGHGEAMRAAKSDKKHDKTTT
ncbi:MAG: hypothetical protein AB7J30_13175 [Hyphomicrobium sp.]|uniref:hypothetical protein n=1 Tax=Hyphomicrobium sp. TaxID=82 RepID=UPI003D09BB68